MRTEKIYLIVYGVYWNCSICCEYEDEFPAASQEEAEQLAREWAKVLEKRDEELHGGEWWYHPEHVYETGETIELED